MDPLSPHIFIAGTSNGFSNSNILQIVIILICIILSAIFAAIETSFSKCNKYKIASHADDGNKNAKLVLKILDDFDKSIIVILICINVFHILSSTLATIVLINLIPNEDLASLVATIGMTLIVFFFSEMLPKNFASINPDSFAEKTAPILYVIGIILTPIAFFFNLIVSLAKKIFKVDDSENEITEDDFQDTVSDIAEDGILETEESEIIQAAVDFGDFTVKDVITTVDNMVGYDAKQTSKKDVLYFLSTVPYSRIPVYEETTDNIIGVLHVKKYLLACKNRKSYFNFRSMLTQPLFVDSKTKIDDMFDIFQAKRTHIAFVKENNKKVIGMVTMEDIVEKLVGDIDEKNPPKVKLGGRRV